MCICGYTQMVYMDARQQKGYQIAKMKQIVRKPRGWVVPSQSSSKTYFVDEEFVCNCPDSVFHKATCKHAFAVRYSIKAIVQTPQGMGMKKGNISLAVEEAINLWIENRTKKRSEAYKKAWVKRKDEF